jgi:hypothetical protein
VFSCGAAAAQPPLIELAAELKMAPGANIQVGSAGDKPALLDPNNFGTAATMVTPALSSAKFLPSSSLVSDYHTDLDDGQRWAQGSQSHLWAPLDLADGALLTGLDLYYYDPSATANIGIYLCRYFRSYSTGGNPGFECLAAFISAGTPGYATAVLNVPPQYQTIRHTADINSDGVPEAIEYFVNVSTDAGTSIVAVRPFWKRQISPAPATATFLDVPTSHPFFRFVEALRASGITGGCGGGQYCPDAPLTRGQMAVFLSTALGLHWPGV